MTDIIELLHSANQAQKQSIRDASMVEREYREAKAKKWVELRSTEGVTAKDKEAQVDGATAELREKRDIAVGMIDALKQEQMNLRAQSFMQGQMAQAESPRGF